MRGCACRRTRSAGRLRRSALPLFVARHRTGARAEPRLHPHLDRCEQSAPLFGRELARAKALVPCVAALLAALVYAGAQLLRGAPDTAPTLLIALAAVLSTTLISLSATIRRGTARALYVVFRAASGTAYLLALEARSVLVEVAFCAIVAFFALRQYGEALARYDPI